jgi:hypothetical protein
MKNIRALPESTCEQASGLSNSQDAVARRHVAIIIPRGEVIRNFVHSGCLTEIGENAALSLITVEPNAELSAALHDKYRNVFALETCEEKWLVRFQREILDVAHGRWLWSRAARRRWQIRDNEAKTVRQKVIRSAKKSLSIPIANKIGLRVLSRAERLSSRFLRNTDEYINLYKTIKPTLVFNGSHIHSANAIQAVESAQWLGIPTATFIFSWDNLTSQGRINLPYDYFLVWNEDLKEQLLEMYDWIKRENVFVTGTPQFDFHFRSEFYQTREEFCEHVGADHRRPILFYATGMANHMPGEPEIVEGIADMLNELAAKNRPQLLVRVYPKDRSGRFDALKSRRKDILFPTVEWEDAWMTPRYEDSYALVNTLRHCSLGINVASTISLELCMFDKPVINVGYNPPSVDQGELRYADYYEFDHYKPVVDSDAVQVAWSEDDMRRLIIECLVNPADRGLHRKDLIGRMFGTTLDGNSSKRVGEVLLDLADRQNGSLVK